MATLRSQRINVLPKADAQGFDIIVSDLPFNSQGARSALEIER
jgi:hypothetical protein